MKAKSVMIKIFQISNKTNGIKSIGCIGEGLYTKVYEGYNENDINVYSKTSPNAILNHIVYAINTSGNTRCANISRFIPSNYYGNRIYNCNTIIGICRNDVAKDGPSEYEYYLVGNTEDKHNGCQGINYIKIDNFDESKTKDRNNISIELDQSYETEDLVNDESLVLSSFPSIDDLIRALQDVKKITGDIPVAVGVSCYSDYPNIVEVIENYPYPISDDEVGIMNVLRISSQKPTKDEEKEK